MMSIRWIVIALAVIGFAGLAYWLTRHTSSKKVITTADLTGLTSLLSGSTLTTNTSSGGGGGTTPVDNSNDDDVDDDDSGNQTNTPNWTVGDYGAETGTDYQGNPFIRSAAPTIPFEAKTKPYIHGVTYTFAIN